MLSLFIYLLIASVHSAAACEHDSIVVDANGSSHFSSIQAAVDFVLENNMEHIVICIRAGHYVEKVIVLATKPYVTFQGSGRGVTVISWHDQASERGPEGQ